MEKIDKMHNSIDFGNLTYRYQSPTANLDLNNFIDAASLFDGLSLKE